MPNERFVSEPLIPVTATIDTSSMVAGEPGVPMVFVWRDTQYTVARIIQKWKETSPCKSGANEMYVRKHWFRLVTTCGKEMKVYFERQPASKRQNKARWWLFSISTDESI
jgi:hypothetical protein